MKGLSARSGRQPPAGVRSMGCVPGHCPHQVGDCVHTLQLCSSHMNTSAVLVSLLRLHDPISSSVFLPTFLFLTLLYVSTQ